MKPSLLWQKAATFLWAVILVSLFVTGFVLGLKLLLGALGGLFAAADGAGSPNAGNAAAALPLVVFYVMFMYVWRSGASLVELFALLLMGFVVVTVLRKRDKQQIAAVAAAVCLLAALPFASTAAYFLRSNAQLPNVPGVDQFSYHSLGANPQMESRFNADKNHVYCGDKILEGADSKTFAMLLNQGSFGEYAKDAAHAWWGCDMIPNADASSFASIANDPQTSDIYSSNSWADSFAKDMHSVYFQGKPIESADPATYQLLGGNYMKDAYHVWVGAYIIEGADASSFVVLTTANCLLDDTTKCPPDSKDANHKYFKGRIAK